MPSHIHVMLKHPMLVAIKIWALAHLLANGDLAALVLFGSFLAFAVYDRISVKRRGDLGPLGQGQRAVDQRRHRRRAGHRALRAIVLYLHQLVIGVSPLRDDEARAVQHERKRLIGIAWRDKRRRRCRRSSSVDISLEAGVAGDSQGRQVSSAAAVTILAREDWEAALADLGGRADLDWTARRANLLVEGVRLPRALGPRCASARCCSR